MTNFREFTSWLFPYQEIYRENPPKYAIPEEIVDVLDQISADTGIPENWLYDTAGYVVDGLAGLKCLWYLHGAGGKIEIDVRLPEWVDLVVNFAKMSLTEAPPEHLRRLRNIWDSEINWKKGTVTFSGTFSPEKFGEEAVDRQFTVKLGAWLEKYIQVNTALTRQDKGRWRSEMKQRAKSSQMIWRISAHPYDVLTMSFKRPWASCMRPGSGYEWEYGILTDLAAGSAIMFFYEEGTDVPAGRLILRPALDKDGDPCILSGRTVYGRGPSSLSPEQLDDMLESAGFGGIEVFEKNLCKLGREGKALSRQIYSDVGSVGCKQTEDAYDKAYEAMGEAGWPEAEFELSETLSVAEMFSGDLTCELPTGTAEDEEYYE